jgi:hypothetical protein
VGAQQSVFTVTLPPQYDAVDCASLKQLLYRNHGAVLMGAVVGNTPMLVTSGVKLFKGDVVYILGNPQVRTPRAPCEPRLKMHLRGPG